MKSAWACCDSQTSPNGSLAAGTSATVTVTAYNSSGQCVAGAAVGLFFAPTSGGGTATTPHHRLHA